MINNDHITLEQIAALRTMRASYPRVEKTTTQYVICAMRWSASDDQAHGYVLVAADGAIHEDRSI